MGSKARTNTAVLLLAVYGALGLLSLFEVPEPLATVLKSERAIYWLQALAGLSAVFLLWSVAWKSVEQHAIAREALREATERADGLQRRRSLGVAQEHELRRPGSPVLQPVRAWRG